MNREFRPPADAAERRALMEILSEAFSAPADRLDERVPILGEENLRVLTGPGGLAGGLWLIPMGQWYGGRSVPMTGVAAVGIAASHRGYGAAHELMARTVNDLHDRGVALSALYPATRTLYRKSGYEHAGSRCTITVRARDIGVRERGLRIGSLTDGDRDAVAEVYRAMAPNLDGALDRHAYNWDRVFRFRDDEARGYGAWNGDRLEGYVYILHKPREGGYDLMLTDLAFSTPSGARRLLSLLADHSSMVDTIKWSGGPQDPILHFLPEQRYEVSLALYWMVRVTHVTAALGARGYSPGAHTELHLEISDDVVTGNNGRFVLRVENGTGHAEPGGDGDLRIDVRALAALYTGFLSARELRLTGFLEGTEDAVRRAEAVFTGGAPGMRDMF